MQLSMETIVDDGHGDILAQTHEGHNVYVQVFM